ncbi:MAG TPA: hypothetical protein VND68_12555 [Chloroflexia bacterium]|jgi:hypothetical protein|nr:hypothetical protein [Chloroflexia bacterium]
MSDSVSDGSLHPGDFSSKPARPARPRVEPIPVLDAAEQVTVQIDLLREQYESIRRLSQANGWKEQEGLLTVLMSGVGYLDATLQVEGINRSEDEGELARRVDSLVQDLASYHSMYAVMKFKAFKMYKLNQTLEFNVAGLRATERMWEEWAERMRREQTELRTEVLRLRSVMSEFDVRTRTGDGGSEVRKFDEVLPFIVPALQHPAAPADDYSAWEQGSRPTPADESSHSADTVRLLPSTQEARPGLWARVVQRCKGWFR